MRTVHVENMTSSNGNKVPNQFIIRVNSEGTFFQSYDTIIAAKTPKGILLDMWRWDFSVTTGRYRNQFLGEKLAETRKKIKTGEYTLIDLNR